MRTLYALLLFLAACGAQPAPEFFGAAREEVRLGAHSYVLFRKGKRFEIIRLGPYVARGPPQDEQRMIMRALVEERTGCKIPEPGLTGDAGEMRGSLRCPKAR